MGLNRKFKKRWKEHENDFEKPGNSEEKMPNLLKNVYIMYRPEGSTLNKRSEIFNTCRHRTQSLLEKVKV